MMYNCRSCKREFSKLLIPIQSINNLHSQLRPADIVPDGQCPFCRGFVYAEGRFATAKEIAYARGMYQGCDLEIDNDAKASHADGHVWVQGWVYVPK